MQKRIVLEINLQVMRQQMLKNKLKKNRKSLKSCMNLVGLVFVIIGVVFIFQCSYEASYSTCQKNAAT